MDPELKMNTERERVRERESLLELAMEISLTSLGSSQTLPFPHLRTLEASRFWSLSDTIAVAVAAFSLCLFSPWVRVEEGFSRMENQRGFYIVPTIRLFFLGLGFWPSH